MMPSPVFVSGVLPDLGIRVTLGGSEPRQPGTAFGNVLRCWNCGTQIGERVAHTFYVNSNKVELGGIGITSQVWRRCRGGKANPACRAINTMPIDWITAAVEAAQIPLPTLVSIKH